MMGKRGISEIVAALMLISIAVAASIIIYVYSSGLLGSLQGAQPQQGQYTNQITLEFYNWTTLNTLKLTLRNTGSGLAVFAAFYVTGNKVALKAGSTCTTISATTTITASSTISTLKPQSACGAILDLTGLTISRGLAYSVKVVTKDGGVFSYSCIAGHSTGS
jgi:flagellin-like protein